MGKIESETSTMDYFKNINYLYDGLHGLKRTEGSFTNNRTLYISFKSKYKRSNKTCGLFICRYSDHDIEFHCLRLNETAPNKLSANADKEDM